MSYDTPEARAKHVLEQRAYKERHPEADKKSSSKWYKKNKEQVRKAKARWRKKNPEMYRAQNVLIRAVWKGKIMRPEKCSRCGKVCKPDAHHLDYSKKLEVLWLCRQCHKIEHRRIS